MFERVAIWLLFLPLLSARNVLAAPIDGHITHGSGNISVESSHTTITQHSNRLDIDWREFSIQSHETVTFQQPNINSLAINRVTGGVPSQIDGALNANGRIFVINDAGITFGAGAQINVGSLVATTHNMTENADGTFALETNQYGQIANYGHINISPGGFAVLAAPHVKNEGVITANLGEVHLASGTKATLDLRGDNKILFTLDADAASIEVPEDAPLGVDQKGTIRAQSGKVYISSQQANDAIASVINLDGLIDATSLTDNGDGGSILIASDGHIDLTDNAVLDASAKENGSGGDIIVIADKVAVAREDATMRSRGGNLSGDGGFMEFSGYEKLFVLGGNFDAQAPNGTQGRILFDPIDVTIGTIGGGFPALTGIDQFADPDIGNGIILNTLLNAALADVIIQATNNVTIDAALNFLNIGALLFDHLTVQAGNDIIVNANIGAVGDFDLVMIADDAASPSNGNDGNGAITMADGVSIDVGGGTINLTAAEDITIGRLITTDNSATAIQLTTSAGAIVDAGDTGGADIVAGGRLVVNAAAGFGDGNAIETTVASVDITAGAGAIRINETDALTLTALNNTDSFDLDITVADHLTLGTGYTRTGSGALNFRVNGADRNLTVNVPLITAGGNIDLQATGDVDFNAAADLTSTSANITVKADIDANTTGALTMADGTVFASATGLLDICAGGDLTIGRLTSGNATVNAITVLSTDGEIIDAGDTGGADIVASAAGRVTLNADNGIGHGNPLEVDAAALTLTNTNASAGNRNIEINSIGAAALSLAALTHNGTGLFSINALGALLFDIGLTRTGAGNITLESTTDSITIDDSIVTASGDILIRAAEHIFFTADGDITSTSGSTTLNADHDFGGGGVQNDGTGAMTMADGSFVNTGSGNIIITASENVTLGGLQTTNADAGGSAISITTAAGIVDGGDAHIDAIANNGTLNINATGNIGGAGALDTQVDGVVLTSDGNIQLNETDALDIDDINATIGDITINANNTIDIDGAIDITTGDINITAGGNASLNVNAAVNTTTGDVTLAADDDVIFGTNGDITAATSCSITVTADNDGDANGAGGAVTMADGTLFDAGSGSIMLNADENITLGGLLSTNSGTTVQLSSGNGSILDGGDTHIDVSANNGSLVINASTGIGVGNATETQVAAVDLNTTANGVIQITESDTLDIDNIDATTDDVTITAGGTIDVDGEIDTTDGNISLTANGTASINLNDEIATDNGNVTLTANDNIALGINGDVTITTGGNVTLTADNDGDANGAGGDVTMANGSVINAGSGTITLISDGDVTLGQTITSNNTNVAVQITSGNGGIIDAGDTGGNDIDAGGGRLTVSAATGFGDAGSIEINLNDVVINAGNGAIRFIEENALTLTTLTNVTIFDLNINIGGDLTIINNYTRTGAGELSITTTGANSDLTVNTAQTTDTGDITLAAAGDVNFGVNGDLTSTSGTIAINADTDSSGAGGITMDSGTQFDAGSGLVDLDAEGDITLGNIVTTSVNANAITVDMSGSVLGNGLNSTNLDAQNGGITINATAIGSNPIPVQLEADQLTTNSGGGDTFLHMTDPVTFNPSTTGGGDLNIIIDNFAGGADDPVAQNIINNFNTGGSDITLNGGNIGSGAVVGRTLGAPDAGDEASEQINTVLAIFPEENNSEGNQQKENLCDSGTEADCTVTIAVNDRMVLWSDTKFEVGMNELNRKYCGWHGCLAETANGEMFFGSPRYFQQVHLNDSSILMHHGDYLIKTKTH